MPKRDGDPIYWIVEDSIARAKHSVERARETVRSTQETVRELQTVRAERSRRLVGEPSRLVQFRLRR